LRSVRASLNEQIGAIAAETKSTEEDYHWE
jgi:hypothetical protein